MVLTFQQISWEEHLFYTFFNLKSQATHELGYYYNWSYDGLLVAIRYTSHYYQ